MDKKRRIFAAIALPDEIKKEIVSWQNRHKSLRARWIKPENLHLTLIPPWAASEKELEETAKIIGTASKTAGIFAASFHKIIFGPPGQKARLIWAEGTMPEKFAGLKKNIETALRENAGGGFKNEENRKGILHITIARFRPEFLKNLPALNETINWKFEAAEIALMESILKREGADYKVLNTFRLRSPLNGV